MPASTGVQVRQSWTRAETRLVTTGAGIKRLGLLLLHDTDACYQPGQGSHSKKAPRGNNQQFVQRKSVELDPPKEEPPHTVAQPALFALDQ